MKEVFSSSISLSLFEIYFIYPTFISLLLFNFDFYENRNLCFSKNIYYAFDDLIIVIQKIISLSLLCVRFIVVIRRSFYYRYSILIPARIEIRVFLNIFLLCARKPHYYYLMHIICSIISLSLFDVHFIYSTFASLSLFDFDFYKNQSSCFSQTFSLCVR